MVAIPSIRPKKVLLLKKEMTSDAEGLCLRQQVDVHFKKKRCQKEIVHRIPTLSLPGRCPNLKLTPGIKTGQRQPVSPSHDQPCRTHPSVDICVDFI